MRKPWLRVLAGIAISGVVTAGVLEVAIRVLHLIPDNIPLTYHAAGGDEQFAPDPNSSARSILGIIHRTNSMGLRGAERPATHAPGHVTVAVLGDSVVWGYGIPEEETIPAWLERLGPSRGLQLEAWNLGVSAYNTFNEKAKYARLGPLLHPDVTIIVVLFNDLMPAAEHFRITSVGTLADSRRSAPYPDEWRPLLEKSALFHAAILLHWRIWPPKGEDPVNLANLPAVIGQLDEIRTTANGLGSKLIVAAMPSAWPDAAQFAILSNGLRTFCEERRAPFIDLSEILGRPARREYLLPADPIHPTPEGARLIAEALLRQVAEVSKSR
jgi:lysophospholipase L1-like esterase